MNFTDFRNKIRKLFFNPLGLYILFFGLMYLWLESCHVKRESNELSCMQKYEIIHKYGEQHEGELEQLDKDCDASYPLGRY